MESIPKEVMQQDVLLSMNPTDLLHYCQISQYANNICHDSRFINQYYTQHNLPKSLPLEVLADFNWSIVWIQRITDLIASAHNGDISKEELDLNAGLVDIFPMYLLSGAINLRNEGFTRYILNTLQGRKNLKVGTFLRLISYSIASNYMNDAKYFMSFVSDAELDRYYNEIAYTKPERFTNRYNYIRPLNENNIEVFWKAVENGDGPMTDFFYNLLYSNNVNPLADGTLDSRWEDNLDNYRSIYILSRYSTPPHYLQPLLKQRYPDLKW